MADDNKPIKYMRYAIGEIVLVVIGILIALQINNLNQNHLNKKLENKYYGRLLEDLKEEKEILQGTLNYSRQVILHATNAIAVFENSLEMKPNPVDNLIDMYQASQMQMPSTAISTYRELIASGQLNLLQSDSLKTALIRFYEIEWTESTLFNLSNNYRKNLRGKMPNNIQTEIRTKCGDVYIKIRESYDITLPKTCEIDIDINLAQPVVELLRNDESLKKDLLYLIGNESGKIVDMTNVKENLDNLISQFDNLEIDK